MKTPFLPQHAKALTVLLLTIRPDWSQTYTFDALSKMRAKDDDLERIVRVAIRGALTPNIAKPDVLAMGGEHWKARVDEGPGDHGTAGVRLCGRCRAFHPPRACDDDPTPISRSTTQHADVARRAVRASKAPDLVADRARKAAEKPEPA